MSILAALFVGLIIGALARLFFRGKQEMGIFGTIVLGLLGSLVGGAIVKLFQIFGLLGDGASSGLIGGFIGALILLALAKRYSVRPPRW